MQTLYIIASVCSVVRMIGLAAAIYQIRAVRQTVESTRQTVESTRQTVEKCLNVLQNAKDFDHLIRLIQFRLEKSNDNLKKIGSIFEEARSNGYTPAVSERTHELIASNEDLRAAIEKDLPECGALLSSANDSLRNSINDRFWESKINFAKGYMEKCHSKLIERQKSIESERDDFYKRV